LKLDGKARVYFTPAIEKPDNLLFGATEYFEITKEFVLMGFNDGDTELLVDLSYVH
jgi:hypothetical protein